MASNPVAIGIPGDASGVISCVAHAAYYQRVTLQWSILSSQTTVVFTGSGEGVAMKDEDGQTSYELGPTRQGYQIMATFEYSTSGPNGPFQMATVQDPIVTQKGGFTITEVTSEDSTDNDNNDSYLNVTMGAVAAV
jgi:hypothetical protein